MLAITLFFSYDCITLGLPSDIELPIFIAAFFMPMRGKGIVSGYKVLGVFYRGICSLGGI